MPDHPPVAVKAGYRGFVPGAREHIGSSYTKLENGGNPGRNVLPSVPLALREAAALGPQNGVGVKSAYQEKQVLDYGFNAMRDTGRAPPPEAVNRGHAAGSTMKTPCKIETALGDSLVTARATESARAGGVIMKGYAGHIPKKAQVVGTTVSGPPEGNAHRGPKYPPASYVRPTWRPGSSLD